MRIGPYTKVLPFLFLNDDTIVIFGWTIPLTAQWIDVCSP